MILNLSVVFFLLVINVIIPGIESENSICKLVKSPADGKPTTLCPAPKITKDDVCKMSSTWVEITLDATISQAHARRLQIVWQVPKVEKDDVIRLYRTLETSLFEPVFEVVPDATYGMSQTNMYEIEIDVLFEFQPVCLGFYVIYWRNSEVLAFSCLQTNPTWMRLYNFGAMKLQDMFIPGTHDSAAYHTVYNPQSLGRLEDYTFTQEGDILDQLVHGARALDLRVGKYNSDYWAHHGPVKLSPFDDILEHIIHFVEKTKEIVILDFHDFPIGFFNIQDHFDFVEYIKSKIGEFLVPTSHGWDTSLQEIWDTCKYIIVSYNNAATQYAMNNILWPPITQMWGNKQNVEELYDYLDSTFRSPPGGMWAAQAELTARAANVATNDLQGLRTMAQKSNTPVSKWFRGRWGEQCHIVGMDFIRSSSIVKIAIEWNLKKLHKYRCEENDGKKDPTVLPHSNKFDVKEENQNEEEENKNDKEKKNEGNKES